MGATGNQHLANPSLLPLRRSRGYPRPTPHHTPKEWIDKFKGKFDEGWDKYREHTLERQKKLGVVPKDTKLTERSKGLPAWNSVNADQKRLYARMMEVFAGYAAQCDYEMGRIIDAVKELPGSDNTLIVYIAGDNGSSAEGGLEGSLCETCTSTDSQKNGRTTSKPSTNSAARSTSTTFHPHGRTP
jgi:arylsulfatase A-like enzyme